MNCQNNTSDECCIASILKVIEVLQNKAEKFDDIPNTCSRPYLGCTSGPACPIYNTRPVVLYNSSNTEFSFPYELNGTTGTSSILRVEKVNECCATVRILAPNPETTSPNPYVATDSFTTINTKCVCALRCLPDTFVDCI